MLRETILVITGCAALVILPLRSGSEEPSYSHLLSAVVHTRCMSHIVSEVSNDLASLETGRLLNSSCDWCTPAKRYITGLHRCLKRGMFLSMTIVSTIITVKGEPLTLITYLDSHWAVSMFPDRFQNSDEAWQCTVRTVLSLLRNLEITGPSSKWNFADEFWRRYNPVWTA